MSNKENYLRIDVKSNAIDSLNKSFHFLSNHEKDLFSWKWFAISFHHAVHSFMLIALQNTDCSGIWDRCEYKEDGLIDVHNSNNRLVSFLKAYEWIKNAERMGGFVGAEPFKSEQYHDQSMKLLNNRLRNKFIHYQPLWWSIHNQYFADIALPILEVVEFLRCHIRSNFDKNEQESIKQDLVKIEEILKSLNKKNDLSKETFRCRLRRYRKKILRIFQKFR